MGGDSLADDELAQDVILSPATPPRGRPGRSESPHCPPWCSLVIEIPSDSDSPHHSKRPSDSKSPIKPSSHSPCHPSLLHESSLSVHNISPESPLSGSSLQTDDHVSIYSAVDRGYGAAAEIYAPSPDQKPLSDLPASDILRGVSASVNAGYRLSGLIRDGLYPPGSMDKGTWLPVDRLFQLVEQGRVLDELNIAFEQDVAEGKRSHAQLRAYAEKICPSVSHRDSTTSSGTHVSCRGLFAILALMGKVRDTPHFLNAGLSDRDLPLAHHRTQSWLYSLAGENMTQVTPQDWEDRDFDLFRVYQGFMLSPFFRFDEREVPFYDLHTTAVLPFIEYKREKTEQEGYHGTIWRAKIHPAHYSGLMKGEKENQYFAVKQLNDDKGINFRYEVGAWAKATGVHGHPHLIRLLATWKQDNTWHLMFPWAHGGSLRDYWRLHKIPKRSTSLVQWLAVQSLGLAQGLSKIQRTDIKKSDSTNRDWGIHGDIKPENILWFRDQGEWPGTLVIADFGFTRFHGVNTRSDAERPGGSITYSAPEYEGKISRAYDIWALGCVYLEFATWYLDGFDSVDETFAKKRITQDCGVHVHRTDKYFNYVTIEEENTKGAVLKPCVQKWIRYLRSLPDCSRFFHDFLDVVEKQLLLVNVPDRAKCDELIEKLEHLFRKSMQQGDLYCSQGMPKPMTQEMSPVVENIPVPFDYSGETRRKIDNSDEPLPLFRRGTHVDSWPFTPTPERTWQIRSGSNTTHESQERRAADKRRPQAADESTPLLAGPSTQLLETGGRGHAEDRGTYYTAAQSEPPGPAGKRLSASSTVYQPNGTIMSRTGNDSPGVTTTDAPTSEQCDRHMIFELLPLASRWFCSWRACCVPDAEEEQF